MKNLLSVIFIFTFFLIGCSAPEIKKGPITIGGAFAGVGDGTLIVYNMDEEVASIEIKEGMEFSLSFEHEGSDYFTIEVNEGLTIPLFLRPGDNIHIHANALLLNETFEVTGDGVKEALFLKDKQYLDISDPIIYRALGSLDPEQYFIEKQQTIAQAREHYETLRKQKGVDKEFLKLENRFLELVDLDLDNNYPRIHRWLNGLSADDPIEFPEDQIKSKIEKLNYNDPSLLKLQVFRNIINGRINEIASKKHDELPDSLKNIKSWLMASLDANDILFSNTGIHEYVKFVSLRDIMRYKGPWDFEDLYMPFMENSSRDLYKNSLNKIIDEWAVIAPGTSVPDFSFTDINGNEKKLSDLSAKLIYIDVWATWCGPCLREHPNWNALMDEYKGKEIEFLAISIDNTRAPWEAMVIEKEMTGNNWYADNAWQSELAQYFMIRGIPRFLLLDGDRKIIDPSAERPSGSIRQVFDRYL